MTFTAPLARILALVGLSLLAASCKKGNGSPPPSGELARLRRDSVRPAFPARALLLERSGKGRVRYLGADLSPSAPRRGEVAELTHYFQVEVAPTGDADVFVHGEVPGGERVLVADHAPFFGQRALSAIPQGEIWADPHRVKLPEDVASPVLELYVGLFKGDLRWTVEAPAGGSDGEDRIRLGALKLEGPLPADELPTAEVPRATGPITPDGKLDEAAWAEAPVLTFADSMGSDRPVAFPTRLRLLWDDQNLYVGFEAVDADVTERYAKRDDPIYEHETVELFLMPNVVAPQLGPYVELQASPGGVIFDASFEARRQGMNTRWDAAQKVGTTVDGTLDGDEPDRGWVSEWAVPFTSLRGVSAAPKAGDEWRMNAFRIEKHRKDGQLAGEYTAWSPPRVGDFHNTARFGRLRFAPRATP
jgi:hypothetical protein